KTTDKYGESTLDIRAIRTQFGLPALLMCSAAIMSACSSAPSQPVVTTQNTEIQAAEPVEAPAVMAETAPVPTESIRIKADYPREYIVKKGDTLWDISSMFLKDPWYWPEIWQRNPQVENPHLIYPGDILTLIYIDGRPQIRILAPEEGEDVIRREVTDDAGKKVVKLSPTVRRSTRAAHIPTIPSDAIKQFLSRPKVVTKEEIDAAPYIVSSDESHLILSTNNRIYVRGELDKERVRYSVYRSGEEFVDPETGDTLGYEVIYAGEARIDVYGEPSTGTLTSATREVLIGDFLMPTDKSDISYQYYPKIPKQDVNAQVISLFDAISGSASYQIVVINKGAADGLEVGHVLASYYRGGEARDKYLSRKSIPRGQEERLTVTLPDERSGLMMVFRTFDRVSYALILESTRVIRRLDVVKKPR
ncbi:MAG TPA: LysM peptidoglycan-binding domain-containing protein, partial [Gammaproteobacteria bacterium]